MTFTRFLLGWLALIIVLLLAYAPAIDGKPIWDDHRHMTRPDLRDTAGLLRIWREPGVTQQYYPVTDTAFWLQHKLWGDSVRGHHVVNVVLHALVAALVAVVLTQLRLPGAWLTAGVFALHPVHVESVAWISELKNILSAAFYMLALACYLRFRPAITTPQIPGDAPARRTSVGVNDRAQPSPRLFYVLSLLLFIAAVLSKSITASLPAAILLLTWWRHHRLDLKRDILPTLPFFIIGVGMGVVTALVEKHHVIADKSGEFTLTLAERLLIAGRAAWFYAAKLVWPSNLTFIYPRWSPDVWAWTHWAFPLAAAALILSLVILRHRLGRGPLVAVLFFGGTLLPAMGFIDVYPFRYSYVADHFQYLASLGLIALLCVGAAMWLQHFKPSARWPARGAAAAICATLALLTFNQAPMYANIQTLWETTLRRNPGATMAYLNLGMHHVEHARVHYIKGEREQSMERLRLAESLFLDARERQPENPDSHVNLSLVYNGMGRHADALAAADTAIGLNETLTAPYLNKLITLTSLGRLDEAIDVCRDALPRVTEKHVIHNRLGMIHTSAGRLEEAASAFTDAIATGPQGPDGRPRYAEGVINLALTRERQRDHAEASRLFAAAVQLRPRDARLSLSLGNNLAQLGRSHEAVVAWRKAVALAPDSPIARNAAANIAILTGRATPGEHPLVPSQLR